MNIPLAQRLLLTALKHVCNYPKYREPKRMAGDMKTWSPSKATSLLFQEGKALLWLSTRPGSVMGLSLPGRFWCLHALLVSKSCVCHVQQEFDLFSLKHFKRTCNSEFLRQHRCKKHPHVIIL